MIFIGDPRKFDFRGSRGSMSNGRLIRLFWARHGDQWGDQWQSKMSWLYLVKIIAIGKFQRLSHYYWVLQPMKISITQSITGIISVKQLVASDHLIQLSKMAHL